MKRRFAFRNLLKDKLIKNKIIGVYIPIIIIPLLILGSVSNYISSQTIIQSTIKNTFDESILISGRIDMIIDNIENCANNIAKNLNNINDAFNKSDISEPHKDQILAMERKNKIMDELAFAISSDIDCLTFIDNNNIIYNTSYIAEENKEQILCSDCFKEVDKTNGSNIWFPVKKRACVLSDSSEPAIMLGKKILDKSSLKKLGILFITIKESSIFNVYRSIGPISGRGYFIVDHSGMIVSSKDKSELLEPIKDKCLRSLILGDKDISRIKYIGGTEVLLTSAPIKSLKWHLINEIPLHELTSNANKVTVIIVVIGVFCLFIALFGARVLSNVISKPILQLTEKMQIVKEGNLDVYYDIDSRDEIGMLASGFNTMTARIKALLAEVEFEQNKKREYEFALMQAQIKPHFLYNTLDLIYIFCKMGRNAEAKETTKALADFYKIVLSNGCEIITIREEIKNVDNYLLIQRARYTDVFDYRINISKEILDNCIPKLTIQPIVENAIYHGLKPKGSLGSILIDGFVEEDQIVIKVIDDGVGIEPDKLEHLLEHKRDAKKSFGIRNVNERIQLYFGDSYGLRLESEYGKGTVMTVVIPKKVGRSGMDA